MDEAEEMKCPNCKKEMKASPQSGTVTAQSTYIIHYCKECKVQILVQS